MSTLKQHILTTPYGAYTYAYPHKTAYRQLPPQQLSDIWKYEDKSQLFLYLHIPFCEMRCGFCNLFTTVNASASLESEYLLALRRQATIIKEQLGDSHIAQLAIGGGTPTYLSPAELEQLYEITDLFGIDYANTPSSVETSPATATVDRLNILAEHHTQRISVGVQSFVEEEVKSVGRPQRNSKVFSALDNIRKAGIPILNIDLIYGLAWQTAESWLFTLRTALEFQPEEIFLYPLYVRPLTGIGKEGRSWDDERQELYLRGRDYLLEQGYQQVSMRMFRRGGSPAGEGEYCCQNDGMVGLGCGARSYTRQLHYSNEYAVGQTGVKAILQDFVQRSDDDFAQVHYGFQLDDDNQKRRFIIQSLLHSSGLSLPLYHARFGSLPMQDFPQLSELFLLDLATERGDRITLTAKGLTYSDAIGPWLYAKSVNNLMHGYELK